MELHRDERKNTLFEQSQIQRASFHGDKDEYAKFVRDLEVTDDG